MSVFTVVYIEYLSLCFDSDTLCAPYCNVCVCLLFFFHYKNNKIKDKRIMRMKLMRGAC